MSASALDLHAAGQGYLWALRQAFEDPEAARVALAQAGIDAHTLTALRGLEPAVARPAYSSARGSDGRFTSITIPGGIDVLFSPWITEVGAELGTEIYTMDVDWTFAHREVQYVVSGDVAVTSTLADGTTRDYRVRRGDVVAIPAGIRLQTQNAAPGAPRHAHVFLVNPSGEEPPLSYHAVTELKLAQIGALSGDAPPTHDAAGLIEPDGTETLAQPTGRESDLPTWLRWGWQQRHLARSIDHHDGTRAVVVASPDREPADYLPWGAGAGRCFVNPLVAEHSAAVADCLLPAGHERSDPFRELWLCLRGTGELELTAPPLHEETRAIGLRPGLALVVPAGARVRVADASDELVVRRMAGSCAHNHHADMMERKLLHDGRTEETG